MEDLKSPTQELLFQQNPIYDLKILLLFFELLFHLTLIYPLHYLLQVNPLSLFFSDYLFVLQRILQPKGNFSSQNRDKFILSKGHSVLSYYAALKELGFISKEELLNYEGNNTFLLVLLINLDFFGSLVWIYPILKTYSLSNYRL